MKAEVIAKYILETFSSIYEYDKKLKISYGDKTGDINIRTGNLSFFEDDKSLPEAFVWDQWLDKKIPFLFNLKEEKEIITIEENKAYINYDIFAASFYFLSNWQEIHQSKQDKYGRFPYKLSFQKRHDLCLIPLVNYYFYILKSAIEQLTGKPVLRVHSDASLTVFLSHDIDKIKSGWLYDSFAEFKKRNFGNMVKILFRRLRGIDEWNNLDDIVELEDELGVSSTFFFLTEIGNNNADYKVEEVEPFFDEIEDAGSEVGLHGSLGAGFSSKKLQKEIEKLGTEVSGNRFHFLQIDAEKTPFVIDKAGLDYSCSSGFAEQIGFRSGFCFPYRPFNFETESAFEHVQIPLMIMDTTLGKNYMGNRKSRHDIDRQIEILINEVKYFGGVLSILWHNTYFTDYKYEGWGERYIQLIKKLKKMDAAFLTGNTIADYYID